MSVEEILFTHLTDELAKERADNVALRTQFREAAEAGLAATHEVDALRARLADLRHEALAEVEIERRRAEAAEQRLATVTPIVEAVENLEPSYEEDAGYEFYEFAEVHPITEQARAWLATQAHERAPAAESSPPRRECPACGHLATWAETVYDGNGKAEWCIYCPPKREAAVDGGASHDDERDAWGEAANDREARYYLRGER